MGFWFQSRNSSGANSPDNARPNPFTTKNDIMSRIARRISGSVAAWMREGNWSGFRSDYSNDLCAHIYAHDECIYIEVPSGSPGRRLSISPIPFSDFGMTDITTALPEIARSNKFSRELNRKHFLQALKPHLDLHFPQAVQQKFSDVSPEIQRTVTVTFDKIQDTWDYDRPYVDCVCLKLSYSVSKSKPGLTGWG